MYVGVDHIRELKQRRFWTREAQTGSEAFALLICLDATKCFLLSIFTLTETNELPENLGKIAAQ